MKALLGIAVIVTLIFVVAMAGSASEALHPHPTHDSLREGES